MKTYEVKTPKTLKKAKIGFSNNPTDLLKLEDFISNEMIQSEREFVTNEDLFNYIKFQLKLDVSLYSIWSAMLKLGFKRGMMKIEGKTHRGYYAKLKQ